MIVPYQLFDTADRPVCLAPGNDRLWARCAQVLGHPEWATDPRYAKSAARVHNKAELLPLIAAAMRSQTRAYRLDAFDKAGVPCSPVNDIGELAATEQLAAVDLVHSFPPDRAKATDRAWSACRSPSTTSARIRCGRRRSSASIRKRYWRKGRAGPGSRPDVRIQAAAASVSQSALTTVPPLLAGRRHPLNLIHFLEPAIHQLQSRINAVGLL